MSIKSKRNENKPIQGKKEEINSSFQVMNMFLNGKIFIPFSHFKKKNNPTNTQLLTADHIEQLKKELE